MSRLPLTLDEVHATWLTEALSERFGTVRVRSVHQAEVMQGTATKVRLHLSYESMGETPIPPSTLILKGGFAEHREQMAEIYVLEARFYAEIAPQLELRVPRCFYHASDVESGQGLLLLEDLNERSVRFCRVQQTLDFAEATAHLSALARLHARWWGSAALAEGGALDFVERLDPLPEGERAYGRGQLRPARYAHYMGLPRGVAVSRVFHDREHMEAAMEQLRALDSRGPRCLLHGDCHLGNLYIEADGSPGFLDWQSVRQGPWSHDVAYFLGSALDVLDRRRWEERLLEHYLGELVEQGVTPPPFEQAWADYGQQMIYGLFYWLTNPVEFQVEVNNCAVAPRFAIATIDHHAFQVTS